MRKESMEQRGASTETNTHVRSGRDLFKATVPFAAESVATSWWLVVSTFVLLVGSFVGAALAPVWPLRLLFSLLAALLMMRAFIMFHDHMHGAILSRSRLARTLFQAYGALSLTPPQSWKSTHNYHHGHVGQFSDAGVGAFPIMSTEMWHEASRATHINYRVERHPLTILAGYITVFLFSICLLPLLRDPARHWDSLLALLGHGTLIAVLWIFGGYDVAFFVVLLPMTVASALGSYLFFAQHSFKHMHIMTPETWTCNRAALESSSYLQLNKVMQWFTGNIGFHHVHHINVRIPFYRLPAAMKAIPELQSPLTTSLSPRDILDCFRCCLWDEGRQRMVTYREARQSLTSP